MTDLKRGGQPGNQNAVKQNRRWRDAIQRAVARYAKGNLEGGLDAAADKLVQLAMRGDKWALSELGDRVDGKAQQTVDTTLHGGSGLLAALAEVSRDNTQVESGGAGAIRDGSVRGESNDAAVGSEPGAGTH